MINKRHWGKNCGLVQSTSYMYRHEFRSTFISAWWASSTSSEIAMKPAPWARSCSCSCSSFWSCSHPCSRTHSYSRSCSCSRARSCSCSSCSPFISFGSRHGTVGKMTCMLGIKFCLDLEPELVLISLQRCLQSLTARNCNDKKSSIGIRGRRKARILSFWSSGFEPCLRHFFFFVWFCQIWTMTSTTAKIITKTTTTITETTKATTATEKFKKNVT